MEELKALEEQGIIEAVKGPSAWVSRMVVVPKADGGVRICQDLRDLNAFVIPEKQQIPTLEEITEEMADAKLFSELDIRKAFYQIPVHESSRHLFIQHATRINAAQETQHGLHECLRNSPKSHAGHP